MKDTSGSMTITIASDTEREDLFAELWYGEEQWGEITRNPATGTFDLRIFAPQSGDSYQFSLVDVQDVLKEAERRLRELSIKREPN